jgi:hypothetical protein
VCRDAQVRAEVHVDLPDARVDGDRRWSGNASLATTFGPYGVQAVTLCEEVRPMNAVRTWVLPLVVTVGRAT